MEIGMNKFQAFLAYPAVRGAITGFLAAALVDYGAFRSWKNFHDAYAYDWPTAGWRWLQGIVTGAISGAGLGLVS
jgi:hypothetical protein